MVRMIFLFTTTIFVMTAITATIASAADNWLYMSVKDALQSDLAKDKLDSGISFFMKGQSHPRASDETREFTANKRARKFGRSQEEACQYAFVSALIAFQQRADKEGRNAAIDLYSITKDKKFESSDQYSCLVGGMVANVAIRGKVANIGK
ncbi:MAG: hypothetical protein C0616_14330 [Desulfuromonas sp.]|nr:MAG: hypothetical protein C0616_14330 [Desulfuromonas sp.]